MQWFAYVFIVAVLFGCSWFSKSSEELVEPPAPRIIQSVASKKPAKREPGSLWSDESKWNELFALGTNRQPGDIITVQVTDSLKARIAQLVAAKTGKPIAEIRNGGEPVVPVDPKVAAAAAASPERAPANVKGAKIPKVDAKPVEAKVAENVEKELKKTVNFDTKSFEATILEILPNGVYKIASNQGLKVGGPDEPYVSLEGNLREKEVAIDNSVSADVLLGTKLELVDMNSPNVIPAK